MNTTNTLDRRRQAQIALLRECLAYTLRRRVADPVRIDTSLAVCGALVSAIPRVYWGSSGFDRTELMEACDALTTLISQRLGDYVHVHGWLGNELREKGERADGRRFGIRRQSMLDYRRRWVQDMIRTLENGGDL